MTNNWIVTSGKAEINSKYIKYLPTKFKNKLGNEENLSAVIKSNVDFESGEISFKVKINDSFASCQVIFNYDAAPLVVVGINAGDGAYGIAKLESNNKVDSISSTGMSDTIPLKTDLDVKISVRGSYIELLINDIIVATAYERVAKSQIALFLASEEEILVKDFTVITRKPKAFVVMQFTEEYNELYREVIKPIVEDFGIEIERADEVHTTNPILQDIVQSIRTCSIIIADITPNNPNVFYEVGYAHAIDKPTILLCDRKREKLPFDISGFRTLFYDNTISGKSAVEKSLRKFLETIF